MGDTQSPETVSVLVVEDDEDLADLYADWLAPQYEVQTAYSAEIAMMKLDDSVDILLLDRRLPGMSGDTILERIEEQGLSPEVAIVSGITPGFGTIGLGIAEYLTKPVDREELLEVVETLTARSRHPEPNDDQITATVGDETKAEDSAPYSSRDAGEPSSRPAQKKRHSLI